jgi:dTDP-4-amino-4,6-dideoxygalactose transaminase
MKMVINGKWIGSLSDRTYSLRYPANGEAGMITTDADHLAEKIQKLCSHGMTARTRELHRGHVHSYDEYAGEHEVTLPLYTQMTAQEIDTVATAVGDAVEATAEMGRKT